jgi:hypothetical protein
MFNCRIARPNWVGLDLCWALPGYSISMDCPHALHHQAIPRQQNQKTPLHNQNVMANSEETEEFRIIYPGRSAAKLPGKGRAGEGFVAVEQEPKSDADRSAAPPSIPPCVWLRRIPLHGTSLRLSFRLRLQQGGGQGRRLVWRSQMRQSRTKPRTPDTPKLCSTLGNQQEQRQYHFDILHF